MHKPVFVAITGTNHYYGSDIFIIGLVMQLVKDRGNPHDDEAIRAEIPPIGKVGYVVNRRLFARHSQTCSLTNWKVIGKAEVVVSALSEVPIR